MTREDAIKIIKNEEDCVLTDCYRPSCESCNFFMETNDILTALDMAIEALEQEQCEDAVSREAAIDAVKMAIIRSEQEYAVEALEKIPPVTPKPRTGEWMKSYADHEAFGIRPFFRFCSECNEATVHPYNYCPNCGAKMNGGNTNDHNT